jgi:Type IV secretion system pilin
MTYKPLIRNLILQIQKFGAAMFLLLLLLPVSVSAQSTNLVPSKQVICGGSCPLIDGDFNPSRDGIANFIISIARFLTYVGGALTVLFLVYGGLLILTDLGGGKRAEAGWNCIKTSIIGLVIIIVAYTAVSFIGSFLNGANFDEIFVTN